MGDQDTQDETSYAGQADRRAYDVGRDAILAADAGLGSAWGDETGCQGDPLVHVPGCRFYEAPEPFRPDLGDVD